MTILQKRPEERIAQTLLADEVTELIHTRNFRHLFEFSLAELFLAEGVRRAKLITTVLFGTDVTMLDAEEVLGALAGDRRLFTISADEMYGTTVQRLTVNHGITKSASTSLRSLGCLPAHFSIGAAKSLVAMRGLYLNGQTVDAHRKVQPGDLIDGRLIIVRAGRDKHAVFALRA